MNGPYHMLSSLHMWIENKDVNLSLTYGNLRISGRTPLVRLPHRTPREALALSRPSVVQEVASETQVKHLSVARKIRLGEERDCVLLERIAIGPADRGRDGQFGKG